MNCLTVKRTTRSFAMILAVAALAVGFLTPGFAQSEQPNPESGRAVVVGTFSRDPGGACFQCHGMEGAGDAAAAFPRLAGQEYEYLLKSLKDYASGARANPIMSPIAAALSQQEMQDVSAYYAGQSDVPVAIQSPVEAISSLQYGAALSAIGSAERGVQACVNCHGPQGSGLAPTYPYLAGQHASYVEAQLMAWKQGTRTGDPSNVMGVNARHMTNEDIRAVAAYFASLPAPTSTDEGGAP